MERSCSGRRWLHQVDEAGLLIEDPQETCAYDSKGICMTTCWHTTAAEFVHISWSIRAGRPGPQVALADCLEKTRILTDLCRFPRDACCLCVRGVSQKYPPLPEERSCRDVHVVFDLDQFGKCGLFRVQALRAQKT